MSKNKEREIKFRGKRIDNGEWVYGSYYHFKNPIDNKDAKHFIFPPTVLNKPDVWLMLSFEVDFSTVGEFTGLKDKHGNDIYEGELVKDHNGDVWLIRWSRDDACWVFQNPSDSSNFNTLTWLIEGEYLEILDNDWELNVEIIGNIHYNKPIEK